ncbi:MAG TPA: MraY family glycosyltransferase [Gemmatimonadales bacterium]
MLELLLAALIAGLVGIASVPLVIRAARAHGLLDVPDSGRRWHRVAVPRLGGVAVWLGTAAGFAALVMATGGLPLVPAQFRLVTAFVAALAVMFGVGLYDDLRDISPRGKFIAQCVAAAIVVLGGFRLETITLGSELVFSLGWFTIPVSLFWIVGVTNAFNLVDGLDGLAGGISLIALVVIGAASILLGNPIVLGLIVPLAAAVAGFLRYNVSPARIFLGDVGSLTLGLTLAVMSVEGTRQADGAVHFPVALFALAFPLLDICTAMLRRWLRGVPMTSADDRHVHHQLVALGLSHRRAAALIWVFAAGVAGFGLSVSLAPPTVTLLISGLGAAAFVLVVVHGAKWLHYHEFVEAQASFASGVRMARFVIRDRIRARDMVNQIRSASSYEDVCELLQARCKEFGFESMTLSHAGSALVHPLRSVAPSGRSVRLDWPILASDPGGSEELTLSVSWCSAERAAPLYAERVISIVAPAIQEALFSCGSTVDSAVAPLATAPASRLSLARRTASATVDGHVLLPQRTLRARAGAQMPARGTIDA